MKKKVIKFLIIIILILLVLTFLILKIKKSRKSYEIEKISNYNYFVVKENGKFGVINRNGEKIIDTKYDDVKIPNPSVGLFCCVNGENIEILNEKSEEILKQYEKVDALRLKNISGDLMYEKSTLKYSKNGKYGIINFKGKKITKPIYEEVDTLPYAEGKLLIKKNGKYGVININGDVLVKPNYDNIEIDKYYVEGKEYEKAGYIISNITNEGYRYGYIDCNGKKLLDTKYNSISRINEIDSDDIYLICAENGQQGLLKNGKNIIPNDYQSLIFFAENKLIEGYKGKKIGVFDLNGKVLVPFKYSQIDISGEYIYAKTSSDETEIFNLDGSKAEINENRIVLKVKDTNYKINILTENNETKYSIYENDKKVSKDYSYLEYLFDNYFIACEENGKLGIIDTNGNIKVDFTHTSIQKLEKTNLVYMVNSETDLTEIYSKELKKICELKNAKVVENDDYLKLYNDKEKLYVKNNEVVSNMELFTNNNIFSKEKNNLWGFVDKNGKVIVDYKYEMVEELNEYGFASVKKDGKWGSIDSLGNVIAEPIYEFSEIPNFIGKYYKVIYGNGEVYYSNEK